MKRQFVHTVERINDSRWDTWVCIRLRKELETFEQYKKIKEEILDAVNGCHTNLFYNIHTGAKVYKEAHLICGCEKYSNGYHFILDDIPDELEDYNFK